MKTRLPRTEIPGRILDATDRLLARYGYKKMTIDDLAKEVGIGKGSIYLHFRSKEEVVYSHIDRVIARLLERLKQIAQSRRAPTDKLREMIVLRVMFRFDSVQHFPESLSDMFRDLRPEIHRRRQNHFKEEARLVAKPRRRCRPGKRLPGEEAHGSSLTRATLLSLAGPAQNWDLRVI